MMEPISNLFLTALQQTGLSLLHNWPYLLAGIVISALVKVYVNADRIAMFLKRFRGLGILAATAAAVGTPLCSCGTTVIVLGMMTSTMPWAPIVAFMVSSPLTSPEGLFYSAGLFGWPFAWAFFIASIILGLGGGAAAALFENWGWLVNQARFASRPSQPAPASCSCGATATQAITQQLPETHISPACECGQTAPALAQEKALISLNSLQPITACACSAAPSQTSISQPGVWDSGNVLDTVRKLQKTATNVAREIFNSGKQLLPMFFGFAFIGFLLNSLIPASWISAIFGSGKVYSVPLAATLGLPLYFNSEGALPLIRALLDNGMSQGAALAFMIAGAGTSMGAIAGALTIARWRVVSLIIGILWVGAILAGYIYDLLLAMKLF
jgi:uncharacterized protein